MFFLLRGHFLIITVVVNVWEGFERTHFSRATRSSGIIVQLHPELTAGLMNGSGRMLTDAN